MSISKSFPILLLLSLGLGLSGRLTHVQAQTLPLADNLTSLLSPEGQALLQGSDAQADYVPLSSHFSTQQNPAFCGVASMVMVLNALNIPAPIASEWNRAYFTQENLLNEETATIIPRERIARMGLTLAELAGILEQYPVNAEIFHGEDVSLEQFRELVATNLAESNNFVLVNYLRRAIAQERGGHISPIAAYDADTDQFLILDVSRYKYPPVWVSASELWNATNTIDSVSGKTRGFLLISPTANL
ncbi:MAG: glutathione gamma-glutamylcysteinyltransferase [Merismopedia sp. SIO2A8]|nr:glutathione gamma-glutamylcysteinyltransferase [Symploca sp. SIO2B6]NET48866.1 glutathione gamma-glutamylcysteinyltransferase [Merismopedia sp. SIO2A8]